jgi:serine/threonine protein kinase
LECGFLNNDNSEIHIPKFLKVTNQMIIRNIGTVQGVEHDLKYDTSWESQMKEHFKIGEMIGGVNCFVKRYDQRVPTANMLLYRLADDTSKQITVSNLPKVYDLAQRMEGHRRVHYYVTECLDGAILEDFLRRNPADTIHLKVLYLHLSKALKEIHNRNFWFSDFNAKNIFYTPQSTEFYLIDVDSAWSNDYRPVGNANDLGGLPGASLAYAGMAENMYRTKLGLPNFNYNQLTGNVLNYLQLLMFIGHLRYYQHLQISDKRLPFGHARNEDVILQSIYNLDMTLCKAVFNKASEGNTDLNFLTDLSKLVDKIIAFDGWNGHKVAPAIQQAISKSVHKTITGQQLEIISFKSSIVHEDQKINRGETAHLTWIVLGHKEDGVLFDKDVVANRGKRTITPYKTTTYTLSATDAKGASVQEKLTIIVQQNTPVWKWALIAFACVSCLVGGYIGIENYRIDSIPIEKAFEEGKMAYNNQSYKKSMRLMTRCIEQNVNKAQAYYWRGLTDFKKGNHGGGCKDIEQASQLLPTDRNVKEACIQKCNCK